MGIESMTGFARAAGTTGVHGWAWEIRSVNGRGLDVRVRVPPGLEILAEAARKRLSGAFARGTLHVNLAVTSDAGPPRPRVNETVLAALLAAIEALPASGIDRPTFDGLLAVRGVVEYADEAQDVLGAVEKPALAGILDLDWRERAVLFPLIAATVFYGVYPAPILNASEASVQAMLTKVTAAIAASSKIALLAN